MSNIAARLGAFLHNQSGAAAAEYAMLIAALVVLVAIAAATLGEVPVNDRYWPKAAVALKPSRMSETGQKWTPRATPN